MAYLIPTNTTSNKESLVEGTTTHNPTNLNDESTTTHWVPTDMVLPCYVTFEYSELKKVTQVEVRASYSGYANTVFDILISSDGLSWVTAKSNCVISLTGDSWNVYTIDNVVGKYLRVSMVTPGRPEYYLLSDVRVTGVSAGPVYKASGSYLSTPIDITNNQILTLIWDQSTPAGTSVAIKTATATTTAVPVDVAFTEQQNEIAITSDTSKKYLWIKVILSTTNTANTPTFSNLKILSGANNYGIFTKDGKLVAPIDHTHTAEITSLIDSTLIDTNGKLKVSLLPSIAINDTWPVADEAAMLALDAQRGDVAIRADDEQSWILAIDDPTVLAHWYVLKAKAPGGAAADGHTHVISDVVGLTAKMTELDVLKAAYTSDLTEFLSIMNGGA